MSNAPKNVKFQYALLIYEDEQGHQKTFDFESWLNMMKQVPYDERVKKVYTCLMRLEKCQEKDERDGLIGLNFLRLRDTNIPFRVPTAEAAEDLDIADDEYVGEGVHIVYDTNARYFMVQVNRFSVSLNSIAAYINQTNPDSTQIVRFKSFHKNLNASAMRFGRYKTIEIGLANVGVLAETFQNGPLGSILNAAQDYDGHTVKIKISVGRTRRKSLKKSRVEQFVQTLPEMEGLVSTAKLTYCEGDMEKGEELNLLDLREYSVLALEIRDRKPLDFDYTIKCMKQEYSNKKQTLNRMLNKE